MLPLLLPKSQRQNLRQMLKLNLRRKLSRKSKREWKKRGQRLKSRKKRQRRTKSITRPFHLYGDILSNPPKINRDMPTVPEEEPTETAPPPYQAETSPPTASAARASHSRAASFSASRDLKQALRRPSISSAELLRSSGVARSPNPLSPGEMAPDIYRKQAETISILTEANEKLEADVKVLREQGERLGAEVVKKEEMVEEMEELKGAMEGLKRKTAEIEKEKEERGGELEKLVCTKAAPYL